MTNSREMKQSIIDKLSLMSDPPHLRRLSGWIVLTSFSLVAAGLVAIPAAYVLSSLRDDAGRDLPSPPASRIHSMLLPKDSHLAPN